MKTATLIPAAVCLVAALQTGALATQAAADTDLRTTDYYLSHESREPFYRAHNLSPDVVVHVREVVAAGNERTVGKDNKVLLFIHGATFPAVGDGRRRWACRRFHPQPA